MSKYTKLAVDAFKKIQMNAGLLAADFDPSTGVLDEDDIIGVTSGGINFTATPEYADFGEDIDNCPKNTKELKRIQDVEVKMTATFAAMDTTLAKRMMSAADIDGEKVTPRKELLPDDFDDLWLIGDYSDCTGETNGGYIAIHILNALSTGGFAIQTTDKGKGKFSAEFTGHYSYDDPNVVPYEVYISAGSAEPSATLTVVSAAGTSVGKTKLTVSGYAPASGESYVYNSASSVTLPAVGDSVSAWTTWNGSDEITAVAGNEIAVAVKDSNGKAVASGKTTVVINAGA